MAADFVVSVQSGDSQLATWSQVPEPQSTARWFFLLHTLARICNSAQALNPGPWLAVPDRVLRLHDAEGRSLLAPDLQNLERVCANKQITSLAWHPAQPILVLGSDKGK